MHPVLVVVLIPIISSFIGGIGGMFLTCRNVNRRGGVGREPGGQPLAMYLVGLSGLSGWIAGFLFGVLIDISYVIGLVF